MQTSSMPERSGTLLVKMNSAASIGPSMAEGIGRGFSIWGQKSAFQIWRCPPLRLRFYLPAHGMCGARRGALMLRSRDRAAGFTVLRMAARLGLVWPGMGYLQAIWGEWAWTLRRMACGC